MPTVPIPTWVRFSLYVASAVGSAVVAYLVAKDYIGDAEVALWASLVAIVNAVSASNVSSPTKAVIVPTYTGLADRIDRGGDYITDENTAV